MTIENIRFASLTAALAALTAAPALAAPRSVDEHRAADPAGQVEIQNVAGRVEVFGWDKGEVAVSGTLGSDVERLDLTTEGSRTVVHVINGNGMHWHGSGDGDTKLVVHVPARSSLSATLVSADLKVEGISGNQELHTVSGDVTTVAKNELRVRTVSGDMHLSAGPDSRIVDISTVSGDLTLTGGAGELNIQTVSGDGMVSFGQLSRGRIKTVSGDFSVSEDMTADGRFEAESVSGDFTVHFTGGTPQASYDLESFSGELSTCFGPKATHESHGPGSRLVFKEGAGTAQVRIDTKSGDVTLCNKK